MSSLSSRRIARRPYLESKLETMSRSLCPLVQVDSGKAHPGFPHSLLQYWLLTEEQLDSLAHFYHQKTPSIWSRHYPCPVQYSAGLTLEEKRRKIGKFIGLQGCETPVEGDVDTDMLDAPAWEEPAPEVPAPTAAPNRLGLYTPAVFSRAPGCRGRCTWDPYSMRVAPSVYCLACGRRAGQYSEEPNFDTGRKRSRDHEESMQEESCAHELEQPLRKQPRPLDVEEVIEEARRTRLVAESSVEAVRRKLGLC